MPSVRDPFVGRERELELLLSHRPEPGTSEGYVDLITGEPGIGKTRLVQEYINRQPKGSVFIGKCLEGGSAPTYWPWMRALPYRRNHR